MHGGFINIDEAKCVNCHQCIAVCPVKYCNDGSGDHIALDSELCIQCGACVRACTHGARNIVDDCDAALKALERGTPMCAIVAPSAAACFGRDHLRINGWLASLGVEAVFDVSFGAELTARSYLDHINSSDPECVIAQPCPVIVSYVQLYHPELLPYLAPVQSPMLHTITMIREYYPRYGDHQIIAVSPCIAKAREFLETGVSVFNVTVSSIERLLEHAGQRLADFPEREFDNDPAERAVAFSSPGGLLQTVTREAPEIADRTRTIEGPRVFTYLDELIESIRAGDAPLLVDCLNCELGCNGGPGTLGGAVARPDELEHRINERRRQTVALHQRLADKHSGSDDKASTQVLRALDKYWRPGLYGREYVSHGDIAARIVTPSAEELANIYHSMIKYDDADVLNCSSCGYNSCEGMAKAIHNAVREPAMRQRAEVLGRQIHREDGVARAVELFHYSTMVH